MGILNNVIANFSAIKKKINPKTKWTISGTMIQR